MSGDPPSAERRRAVQAETLLPRRYRLIKPLGQGAHGTVWLAIDRFRGGEEVAIKVVPWSAAAGAANEQVAAEFLTLRRLAHPNIARVRDFGVLPDDAGAYFASEFVRGGNLLEWAGEGPARWEAFPRLAFQALSALQYLARRGLRHGDIKPANLLVEEGPPGGRDGANLKVIDFATAKLLAPAPHGVEEGTPAYLPAPELIENGADPDLHGLGVSLFHAAAGRLPFRVGDAGALAAWRRERKPLDLLACEPGAPAVLARLIEGLTTPDGLRRFQSASEALEFLKERLGLTSLRPVRGEARGAFSSCEDLIERLLGRILNAPPGTVTQLVVVPEPASGPQVLEEVAARLQVHGYRSIHFAEWCDARAESQLRDLTEELSGGPLFRISSAEAMAVELMERLRGHRVAILLEHAPGTGVGGRPRSASPAAGEDSLLRCLLLLLRDAGSRLELPIIAAGVDAEAFLQDAALAPAEIEVHALEPLGAGRIADLACDFFGVDDVPEGLGRWIADESGGMPSRVHEAFSRLAGAGAAADLLGRLQLPSILPRPLCSGSPPASRVAELPLDLRRTLGLLAIAGEPLDAADLCVRFPQLEIDAARRDLATLRARGFLRREETSGEGVYRLAFSLSGEAVVEILGTAEAETARERLRQFFRGRLRNSLPPVPEALAAAARNELALGAGERALELGLRATRALVRRGRSVEAADLLRDLRPALCDSVPERTTDAYRLRSARLFSLTGDREAALSILEGRREGPRWYRLGAGMLRAQVFQAAGQTELAARELEELLRVEAAAGADVASGEGSLPPPSFLEAHALLATIYFSCGRPKEGRRSLGHGRALLQALRDRPGCLPAGKEGAYAWVLGRFASPESKNGEASRATELLEEASRLARRSGRRDLLRGPLNDLGVFYAEAQDWTSAVRVFTEAEELAERDGDRMAHLRAVYNRAIAYYRLHDLDKAETLFRQARRISDSMGRHHLSATLWLGFAGVLRERGKLLGALRLYRRVVRRPSPLVRPNDVAIAHNNLAEVCLSLGRLDRAREHVLRATRIARATENRFLRGLTLRMSGIVDWALGRSHRARRSLGAALDLARAAADARNLGLASHYLGRLASLVGDHREAVRFLRRGISSSRSAGDRAHRQAGMVALLSELVARGRLRGPRQLLAHLQARREPWVRGGLAARVLELRLDPRWPEGQNEAVSSCRQAAHQGDKWEAFCALWDLQRDPFLSPAARGVVELERGALARRMGRRLPGRMLSQFLRGWGLLGEPAASLPAPRASLAAREGAGAAPATAREPGSRSPPPIDRVPERDAVEAFFRADPASAALEDVLRSLLETLPARLLAVAGDPRLDDRTWYVAVRHGAMVASELLAYAGAVERARVSPEVVEAGTCLFARLAHPRAARVFGADFSGGRARLSASTREKFRQAVTFLSLILRIAELEKELRGERAGHAESKAEVRRLNTIIVRGRYDLETEVLSRRLEVLDLKRRLAKAGASVALPHSTPVGESNAMKAILQRLPQVAAHDLPVLILGESGAGKDLLARCLHDLSARRAGPFLCEVSNLAESLAEAELFGFVKGAFTGAASDRQGLLELAAGGTVYLDEIAGLPPSLQGKLLRVLQEKTVRPLGGEENIPVDFRLVSSSRQSLRQLKESGDLRRDLFYRLNAEVIEIPPLRERREDIPLLARHFLEEFARQSGWPAPYIQPEACDRLMRHDWPGNVRELRNELERVYAERPVEIGAGSLFRRDRPEGDDQGSLAPQGPPAVFRSLREVRESAERDLILRTLEAYGGNASTAARKLKVTRRYLGTLIKKYGIRLQAVKGGFGGEAPPAE